MNAVVSKQDSADRQDNQVVCKRANKNAFASRSMKQTPRDPSSAKLLVKVSRIQLPASLPCTSLNVNAKSNPIATTKNNISLSLVSVDSLLNWSLGLSSDFTKAQRQEKQQLPFWSFPSSSGMIIAYFYVTNSLKIHFAFFTETNVCSEDPYSFLILLVLSILFSNVDFSVSSVFPEIKRSLTYDTVSSYSWVYCYPATCIRNPLSQYSEKKQFWDIGWRNSEESRLSSYFFVSLKLLRKSCRHTLNPLFDKVIPSGYSSFLFVEAPSFSIEDAIEKRRSLIKAMAWNEGNFASESSLVNDGASVW